MGKTMAFSHFCADFTDCLEAKYPEMRHFEDRLGSFDTFDEWWIQYDLEELAKIGFFDTGKSTNGVLCFQCGQSVQDYHSPFQFHLIDNHLCPQLKAYKGPDFYEQMRQKLIVEIPCLHNKYPEFGGNWLHFAARFNLHEKIQESIGDSVDVDLEDNTGFTAIELACKNRSNESLQSLWKRPNEANIDKLLHIATQFGHCSTIEILLDLGANIDVKSDNRMTPLFLATSNRDVDVVKMLLERGATVDLTGPGKMSPLIKAASEGYLEMVKLLLSNGADCDLVDRNRHNALYWAVHEDHIETAIALAGTDKTYLEQHLVNISNACKNGFLETVQKHVEREPDLLKVPLPDGKTTLKVAVENEHLDIVRYLSNSVKFDLGELKSCFYSLCHRNHMDTAQYLLETSLKSHITSMHETDSHTPLWYACKYGHFGTVKCILDGCEKSELLIKAAPDGTSPHFMAFIMGHKRILKLLGSNVNIEEESFQDKSHAPSGLTILSERFPVYNSQIESNKVGIEKSAKLRIHDIERHILGEFCPFRKQFSESEEADVDDIDGGVIYLRKLANDECQRYCTIKDECEKVRFMVESMKWIEKSWREKAPLLDPSFVLVGSIIEGTRINSANELDLTVTFNGLQDFPLLLGEDAFTLKRNPRHENHPLADYFSPIDDTFMFEFFFTEILENVAEIAASIISGYRGVVKRRGKKLIKRSLVLKRDDKLGSFYTHDKSSVITVTHTKCGVCLIFEWKKGAKKKEILTIDLIPVFPVQGSSLKLLFETVTKTLLKEKPPNWLSYLMSFVVKDAILPQSYKEQFEEVPEKPLNVGMKILHYGRGKNFVIRPAQQLAITSEFESNYQLKMVYVHIKAVKTIYEANVSSYLIKKLLLTEEIKNGINVGENIDRGTENKLLEENLHFCLNQHDFKEMFKDIIDYAEYKSPSAQIPIKASKVPISSKVRRMIPARKSNNNDESSEDTWSIETKMHEPAMLALFKSDSLARLFCFPSLIRLALFQTLCTGFADKFGSLRNEIWILVNGKNVSNVHTLGRILEFATASKTSHNDDDDAFDVKLDAEKFAKENVVKYHYVFSVKSSDAFFLKYAKAIKSCGVRSSRFREILGLDPYKQDFDAAYAAYVPYAYDYAFYRKGKKRNYGGYSKAKKDYYSQDYGYPEPPSQTPGTIYTEEEDDDEKVNAEAIAEQIEERIMGRVEREMREMVMNNVGDLVREALNPVMDSVRQMQVDITKDVTKAVTDVIIKSQT